MAYWALSFTCHTYMKFKFYPVVYALVTCQFFFLKSFLEGNVRCSYYVLQAFNSTVCLHSQQQGEEQVASQADSAFPIAAVTVGVWSDFPNVGELILAHFHSSCPALVPFYIPRAEGMSEANHMRWAQLSLVPRLSANSQNVASLCEFAESLGTRHLPRRETQGHKYMYPYSTNTVVYPI